MSINIFHSFTLKVPKKKPEEPGEL